MAVAGGRSLSVVDVCFNHLRGSIHQVLYKNLSWRMISWITTISLVTSPEGTCVLTTWTNWIMSVIHANYCVLLSFAQLFSQVGASVFQFIVNRMIAPWDDSSVKMCNENIDHKILTFIEGTTPWVEPYQSWQPPEPDLSDTNLEGFIPSTSAVGWPTLSWPGADSLEQCMSPCLSSWGTAQKFATEP